MLLTFTISPQRKSKLIGRENGRKNEIQGIEISERLNGNNPLIFEEMKTSSILSPSTNGGYRNFASP